MAKITLDYLRDFCKVLDNWPPGSPDLNPIENLWAIIKKRIEDHNKCSLEELKHLILENWSAINGKQTSNCPGFKGRQKRQLGDDIIISDKEFWLRLIEQEQEIEEHAWTRS